MTLVVALKAADGVALVSDGQATAMDNPIHTRSGDARKLYDLHGKIAFGCSGHAGLAQRVAAVLKREITPEQCEQPIEELRPILHDVVNHLQKQALEEHVAVKPDCLPAHIEVLFAGFSAGEPWVYEVAVQGEDEIHPAGEAIGHARHFPMYLMASTLHYELAERGVEQVKILAYRAVADAIKTEAGALSPPIHAYIVTAHGAEQLDKDRLRAVEDTLNAWKSQEKEIFRDLLTEGESADAYMPLSDSAPGVQL
jgi:20S proteasome alpha/beta subunit